MMPRFGSRFWWAWTGLPQARRLALVLAMCLAAPAAMALPPANPPSPPPPIVEPDPPPTFTAAQYRTSVLNNSSSGASIEAWACSQPTPGVYTTAHASATTGAGYPSSYFAHNVRLYVDGRLEARSADISQTVGAAGPTNYITSIPPAEVSKRMSCPQAFLATIEARGWHKAISILGHSVTLNSYREWLH